MGWGPNLGGATSVRARYRQDAEQARVFAKNVVEDRASGDFSLHPHRVPLYINVRLSCILPPIQTRSFLLQLLFPGFVAVPARLLRNYGCTQQ